jgi:hypothetical protein
MGVWGVGLYSGDFARDLRSTIGALARLPFDGDRLIDILCENERAALDPSDPDHTFFWLVAADQFVKRAIPSERLRSKALDVLNSGQHLKQMALLGMKPSDLIKQEKLLAGLRSRLDSCGSATKARVGLKNPQRFVMEVGDVFIYPTSGGECINSYFSSKDKITGWKHDGWGAVVIVERGRALEFLSWYRPLTIAQAHGAKPNLEQLSAEPLWVLKSPGTCSPIHFKRLELAKIGTVPVSPEKLAQLFPNRGTGKWCAINDISIANTLSIGPHLRAELMPPPGTPVKFTWGRPYPTVGRLDQILSY